MTARRTILRIVLVALLSLSLAHGVSQAQTAPRQSNQLQASGFDLMLEDRSHRVLPLPEGTSLSMLETDNIYSKLQQFRMMWQLQKLLSEKPNSANESTSADDPASWLQQLPPEQLSALKQFAERLQGARQAQSNAVTPSLVQSWLQDAVDRGLPRESLPAGPELPNREPLSPEADSESTDSGSRAKGNTSDGSQGDKPGRFQLPVAPPHRPSITTPGNSQDQRPAEISGHSGDVNPPVPAKPLFQPDEPLSTSSPAAVPDAASLGRRTPIANGGQPATRSTGRSASPGNPSVELPSDLSDLVNRSASETIGGDPGMTDRLPQLESDDLRRLLEQLSKQQGTSVRSVSDFLRQVEQSPSSLPPLSELDLSEIDDLRSRFSRPGSPASQKLKENLKQWVPADLARKLNQNGLGKTLGEMARSASREVRQAAAGSNENLETAAPKSFMENLESNLLKSIGGTTADIVDIASDLKPKKSKSSPQADKTTRSVPPSRGKPGGPSVESSASASKPKKSLSKSLQQQAASWFSRLSGDSSASAAPQASLEATGGNTLGGLYSAVLVCLLLVPVIVWLAKKGFFSVDDSRGELTMQDLPDILNSGDVVRAFHAIASRSSAKTQNWWTHWKAARALSVAEPSRSGAYATLARIYEQVRYAPATHPLTDEQLLAAKQAIQQCLA
ncbi:MAG: hypothetical protein KDB22_08045 [Planctomycetales bacterium]|nr:hypothetical protein [Planctomycetales bacterium]